MTISTYDGQVVYRIVGDDSALNKTLSGVGKAFTAAATAAAAASVAAVGAVSAAMKSGVEYNAQIEKYNTNLTTLLNGDALYAERLTQQINELASVTPLATAGLMENAQVLLGYGLAADDVVGTLQMLGDAAMGDQEKLNGLTLAYSQTLASGKLNGQDALQMINAGIPIYQLLGETFNMTAGEAKEMASAGKISAEMVTEALAQATAEGGRFYGAMENMSQTFQGRISTLQDNWSMLLGSLTKGFSEILTNEALPTLTGYVERLQDAVDENGITGFFDELGSVLGDAAALIADKAPEFVDLATNLVKSLLDGLIKGMPQITKGATAIITNLAKAILEMMPDIISAGFSLLVGLAEGLIEALPELLDAAVKCLGDLLSFMVDHLDEMAAMGVKLLQALIAGLQQVVPQLLQTAGTFIGDLLVAIDNFAGQFLGVGESLMQALFDGIKRIGDKLWDWVSGFVEKIKNAFKGAKDDAEAAAGDISDIEVSGGTIRAERLAVGKDYVPYDDYPALLHQGEAVLTAEEAAVWRAGRMLNASLSPYMPMAAGAETINYNIDKFADYFVVREEADIDRISDALYSRIATEKRGRGLF